MHEAFDLVMSKPIHVGTYTTTAGNFTLLLLKTAPGGSNSPLQECTAVHIAVTTWVPLL
jgi:hypothetical protein